MEEREANGPARRSAVVVIFGGLAALLAGAGSLVVGFLSNAFGREQSRPWIRVGPAEDLNAVTFDGHVIRLERRHAWIRKRSPLLIYIKDLYPKDPIALDATCTHLGCAVDWKREEGRFRCPCHGGVYDKHGRAIAGPPPGDLRRLDVKIEGKICYVRLPEGEDSGGLG